ncbi:hypothetical protein [Kitasatospora sp. NPDC088346]|uniref:hypothetical protein n=1 Tax=Kitasatospora sp. NPDC088346 TaxID=3364073 RepID=UPI0038058658
MLDTAGQVVRLDADQWEGACCNWVTAKSSEAMWDEDVAIALLVPDAPMIQFGDFRLGPPPSAVPRQAICRSSPGPSGTTGTPTIP